MGGAEWVLSMVSASSGLPTLDGPRMGRPMSGLVSFNAFLKKSTGAPWETAPIREGHPP